MESVAHLSELNTERCHDEVYKDQASPWISRVLKGTGHYF